MKLTKALTLTGVLFFLAMSEAHAMEFTRAEIMNMIVPTVIESTCTPAFIECLELSDYTCEEEVIKSAQNNCFSLVPDIMSDLGQITAVASRVAKCIVNDIISSRSDVLANNIMTPACQQLTQ